MTPPWVDSMVDQLAEITATSEDGEHLLTLSNVSLVWSENGTRVVSARDGAAFLVVGEWGASQLCPIHSDCVRPDHVVDYLKPRTIDASVSDAVDQVDDSDDVTVTPLDDDEEDKLVRAASRPTLASLYKGARAKGLVPASPASGASGYF